MVYNYLTRACLFSTQQEWFEAAARRRVIIKQLFESHFQLVRMMKYLAAPAGVWE